MQWMCIVVSVHKKVVQFFGLHTYMVKIIKMMTNLYFAIGSSQEDDLQQAVLNLTAFLEEYQPMSLAVDACRHKILVENCTSINSEL